MAKYELLNNTDHALQVYPQPTSGSKPYLQKLSVGMTAYGDSMTGVWLATYVKGNSGYIDTRAGLLTINDTTPPPIPSTPKLARVKTSYEQTGKSRITMNGGNYKQGQRAGLPDTWQIVGRSVAENNHVRLTRSLQYLWYNECLKRAPNINVNANFNSLTKGDRYITNGYGSDTCRVYPTNANPDSEDMRYFTLVTGNAILEIAGDNAYFAHEHYTPFFCINASKPVENFTPDKYPYRWYTPTNSVRNPIFDVNGVWTGKYDESIIEPFGQFNSRAVVPIYSPVTDVMWILSSYLELL